MNNKHHHHHSSDSNTSENEEKKNQPNTEQKTDTKNNENIVEETSIKLTELTKSIEDKDKQIISYKDQLLRLQAEFDNFRKRTTKEKTDYCKYANERLLKEFLPVLDNFDSALKATNHIDISNNTVKNFVEGINMTYKSLKNILEKEGLKEIKTCGECFNPTIHDAIQIIECTDHPNDCVIEEYQKGYYLGDAVIRHPKVKVAKNTSSTGNEENNKNENTSSNEE